jgi:hypothetical protein
MYQLVPRAPEPNDPLVLAFGLLLAPGGTVVSLPCEPRPGSDVLDCFAAVHRATVEEGGERILGWRIWELNVGEHERCREIATKSAEAIEVSRA